MRPENYNRPEKQSSRYKFLASNHHCMSEFATDEISIMAQDKENLRQKYVQ